MKRVHAFACEPVPQFTYVVWGKWEGRGQREVAHLLQSMAVAMSASDANGVLTLM